MAVALQKLVRRALLARLKADPGVTALVPPGSINPDGEPKWPFVKLQAPRTQPMSMSCVQGGLVTWDIHAFAQARKVGSSEVETAEDHAGSIGGAIEALLHNSRAVLIGGEQVRIRLSDIRLLQDGDPDSYHWFAQANARVLAE